MILRLALGHEHLTAGRIGYAHARAFAEVTNDRNAAAVAAMSDQLCRDAQHTSFNEWRAELADLAKAGIQPRAASLP